MDLGGLQLTMDGVTRSFSEWTSHYVSTYYPHLGKYCYRVPGVHFNRQTLHHDNTFGGQVLGKLDECHARGDLAHTMVLDWLEKLGHDLDLRDRVPLFIISSVEYENYLARLNPPDGRQKSKGRAGARSVTQAKQEEKVTGTGRILQLDPSRKEEKVFDGGGATGVAENDPSGKKGQDKMNPNTQGAEVRGELIYCEAKDSSVSSGASLSEKDMNGETEGSPKRNVKPRYRKVEADPSGQEHEEMSNRSTLETTGKGTREDQLKDPSALQHAQECREPDISEEKDLSTKKKKPTPGKPKAEDESSGRGNGQTQEQNTKDSKIKRIKTLTCTENVSKDSPCVQPDSKEEMGGKKDNPGKQKKPKHRRQKKSEDDQPRREHEEGQDQATQAICAKAMISTKDNVSKDPLASPAARSCSAQEKTGENGDTHRKNSNRKKVKADDENRLPPKPGDLSEKGQLRGDIDILCLHKSGGVVLFEVKSTSAEGGWSSSEEEQDAAIRDTILKAMQQLKRSAKVFHFIMPDLQPTPPVTLVVALPFITRQKLGQVLKGITVEPRFCFLCAGDLKSSESTETESQSDFEVSGSTTCGSTCTQANLQKETTPNNSRCKWWDSNFSDSTSDESLSVDQMKTIVGRICGLMSIVSVWTHNKPRVEVRTEAQAVSEVGQRVSDIVLLPKQAELLADPTLTRVCLTGPMGSGKTLMLQLKGRQLVRKGKRVMVLNVRTSGRGRPIGHVLEQAIRRDGDGPGTVERIDLATKELDMTKFRAELEKGGPVDNVCFVLDELTHHTFSLLEQLAATYPNSHIWSVVMFVRKPPPGFVHCRLSTVLRCPPSVQMMLRELDLNPLHKEDAYTTRSAMRGMPCDGPPIIFIHHQQHNTASRPLDCTHCAEELADILQDRLGLRTLSQQASTETATDAATDAVFDAATDAANGAASDAASNSARFTQSSGKPRPLSEESASSHCPSPPHRGTRRGPAPKPTALEAKGLSFKDVMLLVCMPLAYYKQRGNDLWIASVEDVIKFCATISTGELLAGLRKRGLPLKVVTDNTSAEIALPTKDEIILTDVMSVQSLERKVVIHFPGGPPLEAHGPSSDHGASRTKTVHAEKDLMRTPLSDAGPELHDQMKLTGSHVRDVKATNGEDSHTNSAAKDDIAEPLRTKSEIPSTEETPVKKHPCPEFPLTVEDADNHDALKRVFGNMVVGNPDTDHTPDKSVTDLAIDNSGPNPASSQKRVPRMGMDVRGDSPILQAILAEELHELQTSSPDSWGADIGDALSDAAFLAPDSTEGVVQKTEEREKIREALSELSMDDQDWLFLAAARCLSQLIVVIP